MEHDGSRGRHFRWRDIKPRRVLGLFMLVQALKREYRHQLNDEERPPEFAMLNDRANRIQQRAVELAVEHASDADAVRTLTELAGRHTRDLRAAAHALRRSDRNREFPVADRAYRLLQAAITREPVSRPNTEEQARLDMFAEFRDKPLSEQFRILAEREPALRQVADELAASGWNGHEPTSQYFAALTRLRQVVGIRASNDDPLIRSGTASNSASRYLTATARQRGENT